LSGWEGTHIMSGGIPMAGKNSGLLRMLRIIVLLLFLSSGLFLNAQVIREPGVYSVGEFTAPGWYVVIPPDALGYSIGKPLRNIAPNEMGQLITLVTSVYEIEDGRRTRMLILECLGGPWPSGGLFQSSGTYEFVLRHTIMTWQWKIVPELSNWRAVPPQLYLRKTHLQFLERDTVFRVEVIGQGEPTRDRYIHDLETDMEEAIKEGQVMSRRSPLHVSPHSTSRQVAEVFYGDHFVVNDRYVCSSGYFWLLIETDDGRAGWYRTVGGE